MKMKSEREVAQSCPTPSDPMDCSPPGPSIHEIFQQEHWRGVPFVFIGTKAAVGKTAGVLAWIQPTATNIFKLISFKNVFHEAMKSC